MKSVHSAGIVIYYKSGEGIQYLLLHYAAGHWDFPKGHLEEGETHQEAAIRELHEETGLTADIKSGFQEAFSYWLTERNAHERVHKTVTFFVGEAISKEVTVSWEHQGFVWLPYDAALKKLTYENARQLLKKVHAFVSEFINKGV